MTAKTTTALPVGMPGSVTLALQALKQVLDAPRTQGVALGNWRWTVRQRLAQIKEQLALEPAPAADGWLAARSGAMLRERNGLLVRMASLGPRVLDSPDVEALRADLHRLLADVNHHLQRLHDLAYDDVEIEFGGSE